MDGAVQQAEELERRDDYKRQKAEVKKVLKEQRRIRMEKKFIKALDNVHAKIRMIHHDNKYNSKRFMRVVRKEIKKTCRKFRLSKEFCKNIFKQTHSTVNHCVRKINKRHQRKQALLKRNIQNRLASKMVHQTVHKMAHKFQRNYKLMNKHRSVLDITCSLDPKSCNFFRRSFGDNVPMH